MKIAKPEGGAVTDEHPDLRIAVKAAALDQLLADIRAGLVRIVPMPLTAEMLNEFDYYPRQVDLEDDFRMAIGLAPTYEPLKPFLEE